MRVAAAWWVLGAVVFGCGGQGPGLSGTVLRESDPVQGALVFLSDDPTVRAETDGGGVFSLEATPGPHEVTVRYQEADGALVERRVTLSANAAKPALVELPRPSRMDPPTAAGTTSARLHWAPYTGADFREYKVYRGESAALDETTGTLVYVGLASGETDFVDEHLLPGQRYFYRVFVMNDFGMLAGSNIAPLAMPEATFLPGGDFDAAVVGALPEGFTAPNGYAVSDGRASSGGHAVRASGAMTTGMGPGLSFRIPRAWLIPGGRYQFSYAYFREVWASGDVEGESIQGASFDSHAQVSAGPDSEWQHQRVSFTVPEEDHGDVLIEVWAARCLYPSTQAPDWVIWFDELKVERLPEGDAG